MIKASRDALKLLLLVPWSFALIACGSDESEGPGFATGPLMRPGDDCLRCHSAGSAYPQARRWSIAGTVYASPSADAAAGLQGARVLVTSADGTPLESLTTNAVGNFYSDAPLPTGFRVGVEYGGERVDMPCAPPAGNCGACHSNPPIGGPLGRISIAQGLSPASGTFDCASWLRK